MKQFLIFAIVICFAAAESLRSNGGIEFESREKQALVECARELNVDEKKYEGPIDLDAYEKNPDEETTCMLACATAKLMSKEVNGADNKEKLYNGFSKIIEEAYTLGFESSKFTREDVVNKVEKCYVNAKSSCEFFKCSDFYRFELLELFVYASLQSGLESVIGSSA